MSDQVSIAYDQLVEYAEQQKWVRIKSAIDDNGFSHMDYNNCKIKFARVLYKIGTELVIFVFSIDQFVGPNHQAQLIKTVEKIPWINIRAIELWR